MGELDFPLERVVVEASDFFRRGRLLHADKPAKFIGEGLEVGALVSARRGPAGNELLNIAFGCNDGHEACKCQKMAKMKPGLE